MKTLIPFSLLCAALTGSLHAKGAGEADPAPTPAAALPTDAPKDRVQIAILLDTSNSMDGSTTTPASREMCAAPASLQVDP